MGTNCYDFVCNAPLYAGFPLVQLLQHVESSRQAWPQQALWALDQVESFLWEDFRAPELIWSWAHGLAYLAASALRTENKCNHVAGNRSKRVFRLLFSDSKLSLAGSKNQEERSLGQW